MSNDPQAAKQTQAQHDKAEADKRVEKLRTDREARAKSIGEVASPLLAGFSFTNIIFIATSSDTDNFLLPGLAMIAWTMATIAFITSVQYAKYVPEKGISLRKVRWYENSADSFYHLGVVTFYLGFSLALAPQRNSEAYGYRLAASVLAGIAFLVVACHYVTKLWYYIRGT